MNVLASPGDSLPPVLAPSPPRSPSRPRGWRIHLLLIAAYPLVIGIAGWGRAGALHGPALTHGAKGLLVVCGVELLVFGVVFGLAWLASRATSDDLWWRWRGGFWTLPLGIGYSVAIRVLLGIVMGIVGAALIVAHLITPQGLEQFVRNNRPEVEALVDISALRNNPLYFWLTVTLVSFVVGGFREEVWRSAFVAGLGKVWPRRFGSRAGQFAGVAVAAILFGLGHLAQGGLAVCLTGLLGLGLGVIMVLHRSIWPAVIAHGMFDATSMALLPWIAPYLERLR